ncbi:MAG: hypothetical protein JO235_19665 [Chroococcidiopsidaceae cyanobacterium CP_BM_RX_35]|nr:hypothetical protein [Chroococcidiopsidaceae cyanobacterium CP_BM_RX_35]
MNVSLGWKTTTTFLILTTLFILLTGWLVMTEVLPIKMAMNYSEVEINFMQFWVKVAILIGVILPGTAFLIWFYHPTARTVLGFYLIVLIVQIITEQVLSKTLFPSIVVITGTIYTAFRLWQLWQGQQLIAATTQLGKGNRILLGSLLWLMLLFWLSNLIMLLVLPWSIIL